MGNTVIVAVASFILGAVVMQFLSARFGVGVTVSRPTTTDGENVQLTALVPRWATAQRIGDQIETLSLAAQLRMLKQNELVLQGNTYIGHQKWLGIKRKLEAGIKLSASERNWWHEHEDHYDEAGVKLGVSEKQVTEAAESPRG